MKPSFESPITSTEPQADPANWASPDPSQNGTYNEVVVAENNKLTHALDIVVADARVKLTSNDPNEPPVSAEEATGNKFQVMNALHWQVVLATSDDKHSGEWVDATQVVKDFHAVSSAKDPLTFLKNTVRSYFRNMNDTDYASFLNNVTQKAVGSDAGVLAALTALIGTL